MYVTEPPKPKVNNLKQSSKWTNIINTYDDVCDDICVSEDGSTLRGATIPALLRKLTVMETTSLQDIYAFLLRIRSYVELRDMLEYLYRRFVSVSAGASSKSAGSVYTLSKHEKGKSKHSHTVSRGVQPSHMDWICENEHICGLQSIIYQDIFSVLATDKREEVVSETEQVWESENCISYESLSGRTAILLFLEVWVSCFPEDFIGSCSVTGQTTMESARSSNAAASNNRESGVWIGETVEISSERHPAPLDSHCGEASDVELGDMMDGLISFLRIISYCPECACWGLSVSDATNRESCDAGIDVCFDGEYNPQGAICPFHCHFPNLFKLRSLVESSDYAWGQILRTRSNSENDFASLGQSILESQQQLADSYQHSAVYFPIDNSILPFPYNKPKDDTSKHCSGIKERALFISPPMSPMLNANSSDNRDLIPVFGDASIHQDRSGGKIPAMIRQSICARNAIKVCTVNNAIEINMKRPVPAPIPTPSPPPPARHEFSRLLDNVRTQMQERDSAIHNSGLSTTGRPADLSYKHVVTTERKSEASMVATEGALDLPPAVAVSVEVGVASLEGDACPEINSEEDDEDVVDDGVVLESPTARLSTSASREDLNLDGGINATKVSGADAESRARRYYLFNDPKKQHACNPTVKAAVSKSLEDVAMGELIPTFEAYSDVAAVLMAAELVSMQNYDALPDDEVPPARIFCGDVDKHILSTRKSPSKDVDRSDGDSVAGSRDNSVSGWGHVRGSSVDTASSNPYSDIVGESTASSRMSIGGEIHIDSCVRKPAVAPKVMRSSTNLDASKVSKAMFAPLDISNCIRLRRGCPPSPIGWDPDDGNRSRDADKDIELLLQKSLVINSTKSQSKLTAAHKTSFQSPVPSGAPGGSNTANAPGSGFLSGWMGKYFGSRKSTPVPTSVQKDENLYTGFNEDLDQGSQSLPQPTSILLDVKASALAQELTLRLHYLYSTIPIYEFLCDFKPNKRNDHTEHLKHMQSSVAQAMTSPLPRRSKINGGTTISNKFSNSVNDLDSGELGPGFEQNSQVMLSRFRSESERIQNLFISEILRHEDVEVRADAIMQLISVGEHLLEYASHHALVLVINVLECQAIYRLSKTWHLVHNLIPGRFDQLKSVTGLGGSKLVASDIENLRSILHGGQMPNRNSNLQAGGDANIRNSSVGKISILNPCYEARSVRITRSLKQSFGTLLQPSSDFSQYGTMSQEVNPQMKCKKNPIMFTFSNVSEYKKLPVVPFANSNAGPDIVSVASPIPTETANVSQAVVSEPKVESDRNSVVKSVGAIVTSPLYPTTQFHANTDTASNEVTRNSIFGTKFESYTASLPTDTAGNYRNTDPSRNSNGIIEDIVSSEMKDFDELLASNDVTGKETGLGLSVNSPIPSRLRSYTDELRGSDSGGGSQSHSLYDSNDERSLSCSSSLYSYSTYSNPHSNANSRRSSVVKTPTEVGGSGVLYKSGSSCSLNLMELIREDVECEASGESNSDGNETHSSSVEHACTASGSMNPAELNTLTDTHLRDINDPCRVLKADFMVDSPNLNQLPLCSQAQLDGDSDGIAIPHSVPLNQDDVVVSSVLSDMVNSVDKSHISAESLGTQPEDMDSVDMTLASSENSREQEPPLCVQYQAISLCTPLPLSGYVSGPGTVPLSGLEFNASAAPQPLLAPCMPFLNGLIKKLMILSEFPDYIKRCRVDHIKGCIPEYAANKDQLLIVRSPPSMLDALNITLYKNESTTVTSVYDPENNSSHMLPVVNIGKLRAISDILRIIRQTQITPFKNMVIHTGTAISYN